eukprot:GHRQ01019166.1.p1 GENE.GHRQ01019166.1~~GHRQ01019166.1.p1  ORF type:complete len:129 (-),score=37.07 GHRQ01019166.1:176-562(-)
MRVIPPGLDFSNLKISAPPDPWDAANNAGAVGGASLKPAGGSGSLQRSRRRSSNASSGWLCRAGASAEPASNGSATDDRLAPAGEAGRWCCCQLNNNSTAVGHSAVQIPRCCIAVPADPCHLHLHWLD